MKHLTDADLSAEGIAVAHFFGGGSYIKETKLGYGKALAQHGHEFDHLAYLVAGRVLLTVDGSTREVIAPACITIEAGKIHGIRAVTDATWLCVWATDCTDPAKVDEAVSHA